MTAQAAKWCNMDGFGSSSFFMFSAESELW